METVNSPDEIAPSAKPRLTVARAAIWDFVGRLANYVVLFVVGVILTRLLSPAEFGAFAIVLSVVTFSSIFVDLGFRSAIIQSQQTTQEQLSTVFYINFILATMIFAIFVAGAGYIEHFYKIPGLRNYITAASLLFIINALSLIPSGLLQKDLRLKALSFINATAAAISGAIAITLALSGFGIWALVSQQLLNAFVIFFGTIFLSRWRPSLSFNLRSVSELWHFGIKMFLSGFLDAIFTRMDVFIIGKLFPIQTLGYYNRSQSLDNLVRTFSAGTTASVAFPVIAKMAGETETVRAFYIRALNTISFIAFLLVGILFLTCFDIVIILFTDKWIEVGYFFRIMAVTGFVYPASALMVNLIAARGNAGAFLKLEMWKKLILFPTYLSFLVGGVYLFLVVLGIAYLIALVLNAYFVKKEISVSIEAQARAIFRYGLPAILITAITFVSTYYLTNIYLHFVISSLLFGGLYLIFCYKLKLAGFLEIYERFLALYNDKRYANISPAT